MSSTPAIPFSAAFSCASVTDIGSLSTPTTRPAPSFLAISASTPVPVPTSSTEAPGCAAQNASTAARHSAVVGWSPVPNAIFGSMVSATVPSGAVSHGGPTQRRPTRVDRMPRAPGRRPVGLRSHLERAARGRHPCPHVGQRRLGGLSFLEPCDDDCLARRGTPDTRHRRCLAVADLQPGGTRVPEERLHPLRLGLGHVQGQGDRRHRRRPGSWSGIQVSGVRLSMMRNSPRCTYCSKCGVARCASSAFSSSYCS